MSSKFVLQQEDGTVAGGNARGEYAIDLGLSRTFAYQVASGKESIAIGNLVTAAGTNRGIAIGYNVQARTSGIAIGDSSSATPDYAIAIGRNNNILDNAGVAIGTNVTAHGRSVALGNNNSATHYDCFVAGQGNSTSSQYSTISGGQSNTASTNTHATVVGGNANTSSGQYSVSGGYSNVASGQGSVALGYDVTASGQYSVVIGSLNAANGINAVALGNNNNVGGISAFAVGNSNNSSGTNSSSFGTYTKAYLFGQSALSGGRMQLIGDAQQSLLTSRKVDTLASAATTVLSLDGTGTTNLIIPDGNNRAWNVTVKWVAVCTSTGSGTTAVGDVAIATDSFMFKKVSGTSSIGSVQNLQNSQDATMAGATCSYAVGGSQDLQITFTAPASANATTFRVVAKVELTEVAW